MRNFRTELKKDVEYQKWLLGVYEKELEGLPEGSLNDTRWVKKHIISIW